MWNTGISCRVLFVFLLALFARDPAVSAYPGAVTTASKTSPVIVIGFVGGFVRHDNIAHSEVRVAVHLGEDYASGVYVRAFENRHGKQAHREVLRLLDINRNGTLTSQEKHLARIIIYGHSWGGSEAITLARELNRDGIPVLLTIQVDSVSKLGQNDRVVPQNVAEAANFYQPDGFIHGRSEIRAADAARTQIIGNFRFDYKEHPISCSAYPWYDRFFVKSHTEIECDPSVWSEVESLIRSKLPAPTRIAVIGCAEQGACIPSKTENTLALSRDSLR